jgi:thiamine biosynthesis lipoprotein
MVDLWGFGSKEISDIPSEKEINYLKEQVGCNSIDIDKKQNLIKRNKDIALDFSSIAKGYAIDKLYDHLLKQKNILNFFIELGGEVRSTKFKEDIEPWKIGIINPLKPEKLIHTFYSDKYDSFAMATSGDYRNIRVFGLKQLSHTINVKTGTPNNEAKKSVSVIADNAMKADAMATALNAMKLETAIKYTEKHKIKALFIFEDKGKSKLIFSKELQKVKM